MEKHASCLYLPLRCQPILRTSLAIRQRWHESATKGGAMRRFLWALPVLLAVCTGSTFADSIIIGLSPNNGTGDNFGFRLSGPGLVISIDGGVDVGYFNDLGYAPGSTLGGTTTVFFSSDTTTIRIGDTTYDLGQTGQGSTCLSRILRFRITVRTSQYRSRPPFSDHCCTSMPTANCIHSISAAVRRGR